MSKMEIIDIYPEIIEACSYCGVFDSVLPVKNENLWICHTCLINHEGIIDTLYTAEDKFKVSPSVVNINNQKLSAYDE